MSQTYVVDVTNLTKSFDSKVVVNGVNLKIKSGEIFGFLGANGSGKTTTIRMICGLLTPDAGQGHCLGYDVLKDARQIKKKVGYIPQRFSLYNDLSVYENLEFVGQIYEMCDLHSKIESVSDLLKLQDKQNNLAGELSGGWKQRLAFAACLIHEPQLLLLDEPTAGIDPLARREFWDLIHALSESGVTTLVSTHYMDEAERCDTLAYLSNGKLLVSGSIAEVVSATELFAFSLAGGVSSALLKRLKSLSPVIQAAWFGENIHVCTYEPEHLLQQLHDLSREYHFSVETSKPSLEDAFIALGVQR
jgi:ABC-2 type transport system ATP-binding protein